MANVKISALPATTTIANGDVIPLVSGGVTTKARLGHSGTDYIPYGDGNGNIGIGTAPTSVLHVKKNTSGSTNVTAEGNGNTSDGGFISKSNGDGLIQIFMSGTASPATLFGRSAASTGFVITNSAGSLIPFVMGTITNSPLILGTNNVERAQVTKDGNLLLGKKVDSGTRFQVSDALPKTTGNTIATFGSSDPENAFQLQVSRSASGTGAYIRLQSVEDLLANRNIALNPDGGNVLIGGTDDSLNQTFRVFGSTGNVTGSWVNNSDERLKQNIRPITGALDKVLKLADAMYHYEFIPEMGNPGQRTGHIAQRLEEIGFCGHVVEGNPPNVDVGAILGWEYDEEGNVSKEGEKVKSVDNNFSPYLFPAIKELLAYANTLEARIAVLESRQ